MSIKTPSSIVILGSGVFGLSTAFALTRRSSIPTTTSITIVSPSGFPPPYAASIDTSRIIRADYADPAYASLAADAQHEWQTTELGRQAGYSQCGLVLTASSNAGQNSGLDYVKKSLDNIKTQQRQTNQSAATIRVLDGKDAVADALGLGRHCALGDWGYLNPSAGWASAEKAMRYLESQVRSTRRVEFVDGTAESLLFSTEDRKPRVSGVRLSDGRVLDADLTVLALGASSCAFLPCLSSQVCATAQSVAYLPLTRSEHARLKSMPVILHLSSGNFIIPPACSDSTCPGSDELLLKIACHSYGLPNPARVRDACGKDALVSLPVYGTQIPLSHARRLRAVVDSVLVPALPSLSSRKFASTRLCWYTDTASGDFVICHHPNYARGSCIVATGGSGHAFKFLPIIGDKIVDLIQGMLDPRLSKLWSWKYFPSSSSSLSFDGTQDGSRAGTWGTTFSEEMAKGVWEPSKL